VTVYLTEMHVNKMLSVHKDGSPWVWSRCFLLQLIAAVTTATFADVTVTEAVTAAAGTTNTVTPFAAVTEVTVTATATVATYNITLLAAIYP